jgi:hypothetical protein
VDERIREISQGHEYPFEATHAPKYREEKAYENRSDREISGFAFAIIQQLRVLQGANQRIAYHQ